MHKLIKSLGQNFLINTGIKKLMVENLQVNPNDVVIEIGAGTGALTEILLSKAGVKGTKYFVVEYDSRFVDDLKNLCSSKPNVEIVNANILDWLPKFDPGKNFKVIGSLPYYITSPILHKIIKHVGEIPTCVFLIQKEVAHKIIKKEPDNSYMSSFIQTFYNVKILKDVSNRFFRPVPKVDSSVVKFDKKIDTLIKKEDVVRYEKFLHKAFSSPRKMLNKVFTKEFLNSIGIDETLRPQNISVDKWVELFNQTGKSNQ